MFINYRLKREIWRVVGWLLVLFYIGSYIVEGSDGYFNGGNCVDRGFRDY